VLQRVELQWSISDNHKPMAITDDILTNSSVTCYVMLTCCLRSAG